MRNKAKQIRVLIGIVLLAACFVQASPLENPILIYEAGFEGYEAQVVNNGHPPLIATFPEGGNSTVDDPWRTTGTRKWQSVATGTNGVGTAIGHNSDNAAYFGQNNNTGIGYQQIISESLDVSASYILSFWALPFHDPAPNGWYLKAWFDAEDIELAAIELNQELSQYEWRRFQVIVTPTDFANAGISNGDVMTIAFQSGGSKQVGVYVDDVSVSKYAGEITPVFPPDGEENVLAPVAFAWDLTYEASAELEELRFYLDDDAQVVADANEVPFAGLEGAVLGPAVTGYNSSVPLPNDNGDAKEYFWKVIVVAGGDPNVVKYESEVWSFFVPADHPVVTGPQDDTILIGHGTMRDYGLFSVDISKPENMTITAVDWYKDDEPLTIDGMKYDAVFDQGSAELKINNGQLSDEGDYSCSVSGSFGDPGDSETASLNIRQGLVHRYSFSGDLSDSVSGADGTLMNELDPNDDVRAYYENGELVLDNYAVTPNVGEDGYAYVELPSGIISALGRRATIEVWATQLEARVNGRIFSFSNPIDDEPGVIAEGADSYFDAYWNFTQVDWQSRFRYQVEGGEMRQVMTGYLNPRVGAEYCFAYVWDEEKNEVRGYLNGELITTAAMFNGLDEINDTDCWLGRSQWDDLLVNAKYNELRIYDWAFDDVWIKEHYDNGPDVHPDAANPCLSIPEYDFNGDCVVNMHDLGNLIRSWLVCGLWECN